MATFKDQYKGVMGKREWMLSTGAVSDPDVPGTKAAILSPFLPHQVYDDRDRFEFYERQEALLVEHFRERGYEPTAYMRATIDDFRTVLGDSAVSTIVVTGWGNFSSIAAPLTKDRDEQRFVRLNWQQLSSMADHVKTGSAVMMHCLRYYDKNFNPPLFLGVVTSHANILGNQGEESYAADTSPPVTLPGPITTSENLSYVNIKSAYTYPRERQRHVPFLPDAVIPNIAYDTARLARDIVREQVSNVHGSETDPPEPMPEPLPSPNLGVYKQYFTQIS